MRRPPVFVSAVRFGLLMGAAVAANGASEGALLARWTGTRFSAGCAVG